MVASNNVTISWERYRELLLREATLKSLLAHHKDMAGFSAAQVSPQLDGGEPAFSKFSSSPFNEPIAHTSKEKPSDGPIVNNLPEVLTGPGGSYLHPIKLTPSRFNLLEIRKRINALIGRFQFHFTSE